MHGAGLHAAPNQKPAKIINSRQAGRTRNHVRLHKTTTFAILKHVSVEMERRAVYATHR